MHHSPWSSPSVTPYANRFCGKEFLARAHNSTHWERNPSRNQIWLCFSSSGLHNGLHSRMRIPILPKVWHRFRFRAPRAPRRKVEVKVAAFGFARMRFFFLSLFHPSRWSNSYRRLRKRLWTSTDKLSIFPHNSTNSEWHLKVTRSGFEEYTRRWSSDNKFANCVVFQIIQLLHIKLSSSTQKQ